MLTQPTALPDELSKLNTWLVWRLMPNDKPGGKPRKIPYYISGPARSGDQGSIEDRAKLASFEQALAVKTRYDGIGLAVLPESGIVALDFDNVVNDGVIDPRISALVADTYAEFSPSKTGIRAFFRGYLPSKKDTSAAKSRAKGADFYSVEFFGSDGYVTITGDVTPDCRLWGHERTIAPLSDAVRQLYGQRFGYSMGVQVPIQQIEVTPGVSPWDDDPFAMTPVASAAHQANGHAGGQVNGRINGGHSPPALAYTSSDDELWGLEAPSSRLNKTIDQARADLTPLDPNMGRDEWLKIGAALHHEFRGSSDAYELFDAWSAGKLLPADSESLSALHGKDGGYAGRRDTEGRWKSFGSYKGSPITYAYVIKNSKEARVNEKYIAVDEWKAKIGEASDEVQLREKVCAQIRADDRIDEPGREVLATTIRDKLANMGVKLQISTIRKMVAEKRKSKAGSDFPEWAQRWTWVTDDDKFFRIDTDEWLSKQSFQAKYNRVLLGQGEDADTVDAARYALDWLHVPTATRALYLPYAQAMFLVDGVQCVNKYRPSSVPVPSERISPEGVSAIKLFVNHLRLLCKDRREIVETLLAFIAHCVQQPGVKIRWAPLIKGIEGDGKTLISKLFAGVLGRPNVKNVSPHALGSQFTAWAEGSCVAVLEEVRIVGANKYDVFNALKPYITNDSVPIHPKGGHEYDIVNVTNYFGFTNHVDAMPLNDKDRRWMIIFTPFVDIDALAAAVGGDLGAYFDLLHAAIEQHRADFRRFFLDYQIPASFKPNSKAPLTVERQTMIGMAANDDEMLIHEIIRDGAPGVAPLVLASSYLTTALHLANPDVQLNTTALNRALTKAGWAKVPSRLWWNKKAEWIWIKGEVDQSTDHLRSVLDLTLRHGGRGPGRSEGQGGAGPECGENATGFEDSDSSLKAPDPFDSWISDDDLFGSKTFSVLPT